MKIFNSLGHMFAWVLHVGLPKAETAVKDVEQAAGSPLAAAIAGLIGSKGEAVQAGIEAIAGDVLTAFGAAGAAIGAEGLNVKFDQATVAAIAALHTDLSQMFGRSK